MAGDMNVCSNVQNDLKRGAWECNLPLKDKNMIELFVSIRRCLVVGNPGLAWWVSTQQRPRLPSLCFTTQDFPSIITVQYDCYILCTFWAQKEGGPVMRGVEHELIWVLAWSVPFEESNSALNMSVQDLLPTAVSKSNFCHVVLYLPKYIYIQ